MKEEPQLATKNDRGDLSQYPHFTEEKPRTQKVGILTRVRQDNQGHESLALSPMLYSTCFMNLKGYFLGHLSSLSGAYTVLGEGDWSFASEETAGRGFP